MDLLLWRHAEAEDGHPDAARKLTDRGREQAKRTAEWLAARVFGQIRGPVRILVSPAVRAQQTAEALRGKKLETEPRVGLQARAADILEVTGWNADPDGRKPGAVLVVGHQPTLGYVASLLLSGTERDWHIKKSAVWWFARQEGTTRLRTVVDPKLI